VTLVDVDDPQWGRLAIGSKRSKGKTAAKACGRPSARDGGAAAMKSKASNGEPPGNAARSRR